MGKTKEIIKKQKEERLGEEQLNNQGCLMSVVEYNKESDIVVEFQDEYKAKVHTSYGNFKKGQINNPYYPSVYGVGIVGKKYKTFINGKNIKEYKAWHDMIRRCFSNERFDDNNKKKSVYRDVTCCDEWLLFENFYEWIHSQGNFDKWLNGDRWAVDKDIIVKGNRFYSPKTCCLVSSNINNLFTKSEGNRAKKDLPIGVKRCQYNDKYYAMCKNPFSNKQEYLGIYRTVEESFNIYKGRKEELIKQVAENEYNQGNITKQCYDAMMGYEVEITD